MASTSKGSDQHLVLVGAGHAHVEVLRRFGMNPLPGLPLTLLTRSRHTPYSGMLPGYVAGHYRFDETHIDSEPLARFAGAELVLDEAVGLDLANRRVLRRNGDPIPFDVLSVDIGSTPNTPAVPGASDHALPVKPIDGFLRRFMSLRERVLASGGETSIAVVGGGAGGVELLLSLERRLRSDLAAQGRDPARLQLTLVTRSGTLLPELPKRMQRRFAGLLAERGIRVLTDASVTHVTADRVATEDGRTVPAEEVLWTTEAMAAPWLGETGLSLDERGFIRVASTLESVSHPGVLAAGDVASFEDGALPKAGVFAVRQGPVLAENLRRAVLGQKLTPYRPQRHWLVLISTGDHHAIGTRNGIVFEGDWVWTWKDWIDRRFMRGYGEGLRR
jgi:selenide,water dikinase